MEEKVETPDSKQIPNELFFAQVEDAIAQGQSVKIKLIGNSMRPTLRNGRDDVVLSAYTQEDLKKGSILLFRYHGKHYLHRMVAKKGSIYIMEGDGNYHSREQVEQKDMVAVVRTILRASNSKTEFSDKKAINVQSFACRCYSFWWIFLRPLRKMVLAFGGKTGWF